MNKQEIMVLAGKTNWAVLGAPAHYITCYPWVIGFMRMRNQHKEFYKSEILIFQNGLASFWIEEEQNMKNTRQLYEDLTETSRIIKKWMKDEKEFLILSKKLTSNLQKVSDKELLERFQLFLDKFCDIWASALSVDAMGPYTEGELLPEFENALTENEKPNAQEYFAKLSHPAYVSFIAREHISLLNLTLMYKEGLDIKKALEEHQKAFFWMESNYREIKVLTKEYFLNKIKEESKNQKKRLKQR